jgi:hypothetical protein
MAGTHKTDKLGTKMTASINESTNLPTSPTTAAVGQGVGRSVTSKPRNSCHRCGATAYKTLIARDETGAMRPSGQYQCVQCKQVFRDVKEWRDGAEVNRDESLTRTQPVGRVN